MFTARQALTAGLLATTLIATAPAQAQSSEWMGGRMDTNLYIGGSIGQSKFQTACDTTLVGACDNKDTGYRAFVGWQFHPNFALEGGYFHMGEASGVGPAGVGSFKVRGWDLVGVAMFPVWQQLSLYGKAGMARSRVNLNTNAGFSQSDNTWDFTYGLGGEWGFTRNLAARLEWQRYADVGSGNTTKDDVDYFNAALLYRF